MHRSIIGFHQDLEQHWVAELDCGHCQHTRHEPPFFPRPWVITESGRLEHIGQLLNCVRCDRQEMPSGYAPYRRTSLFTKDSIPSGLRSKHSTKTGIWGIIHVQSGRLRYRIYHPYQTDNILDLGHPGIILPEVEHEVEPLAEHLLQRIGDVEFFIEFWDKVRG
jgi:tellurite methyltransferase